jgi:hypothetical protein
MGSIDCLLPAIKAGLPCATPLPALVQPALDVSGAVRPPLESIVVTYGTFNATLTSFVRAAYFMSNEHIFGAQHANGRTRLHQISSYQLRVQSKLPRPLVMLLENAGFYDCSNPHDRIYALLGVGCEEENLPIIPITVDLR